MPVGREEDVKDLARYVVANPLRAGLVTRVHDYPLWMRVGCECLTIASQPAFGCEAIVKYKIQ